MYKRVYSAKGNGMNRVRYQWEREIEREKVRGIERERERDGLRRCQWESVRNIRQREARNPRRVSHSFVTNFMSSKSETCIKFICHELYVLEIRDVYLIHLSRTLCPRKIRDVYLIHLSRTLCPRNPRRVSHSFVTNFMSSKSETCISFICHELYVLDTQVRPMTITHSYVMSDV